MSSRSPPNPRSREPGRGLLAFRRLGGAASALALHARGYFTVEHFPLRTLDDLRALVAALERCGPHCMLKIEENTCMRRLVAGEDVVFHDLVRQRRRGERREIPGHRGELLVERRALPRPLSSLFLDLPLEMITARVGGFRDRRSRRRGPERGAVPIGRRECPERARAMQGDAQALRVKSSALDKVLGKMGMSLGTLGAEAIPKVFKTFAKILPAVGVVPGLIDAGNYLNEAASLRGKNKDLAMFATVGAGLNTSDVVVGTLLDATGVGAAVDVATGTAFGIAELALDLSFDSEKKKMEANPAGYRAPDWMKAVNLGYGAATGASGAAALIANYGVDGTVDLLKWGSQKGSEAVGKVVASLKDAGSEGLPLLRSLALQGFQSARDALSSLGQSVKNATDGEFQIGGKKIDLNPFW